MAFMKFARAEITSPRITNKGWAKVRKAAKASAGVSENLIDRASKIFGKPFNPSEYLLTHATIVASVDTYQPPNAKLGKMLEHGFRVNRKYGNFRVKSGCDQYINNNCFIPGTPITMADGTVKSIEDVQVGDMVLTHRGRARRVTETFQRDVDGELLEIKIRGSNERLFVTPEHPFFTFPANTQCVACGGTIRQQHRTVSHLLGKHYCSRECFYKHKVPNADLLQEKRGQFLEASLLTTSDFAASPVVGGEQDVGLTLGQARLVGLFAAEGYYELDSRNGNERVGVCWAFHEDERHTLAKTVCDLMQSEFGVECVVRPHRDDKGIHVTTRTCREAVDFFSVHVFGEGAGAKRLHQDLLTAPLAVQMEILRGWFEGDGSAFDTGNGRERPGDFRLTGTTASQSLANQMRLLLHRQGIAPRMHHNVSEGRRRLMRGGVVRVVSDPTKECHSWVLSCGAGYIETLVQDTVYADAYEAAAEARGGFQQSPDLRFLDGYVLQMFTNIDAVEYRGPVYNFETEEDHSYIAGGVAVHNCDAWDRAVLLKSYPTFIGGHNFVEHVQVEELSKGRIIDAVARDIGDSVYVDILIATDRKHADLVHAIESGKMSTLSMGCFLAGTLVTMADGRRIPIEEVVTGDMVITHKGRAREVVNTQARIGEWGIRRIKAVGVPNTIEATDNHPFFVFRAPDTCACGCGEVLPEYKGGRTNASRKLKRRFKAGHDKRILNPNGVYSMQEYKRRKDQLDALKAGEGQWVRADELREGDFLCFPRVQVEAGTDVSTGKARLLGYFLAEGSFLKYKGQRTAVQFNFALDEKDTFVAEVDTLLQAEFDLTNKPWLFDREDRNTCTLTVQDADVVQWFATHGGEYSHQKRLSAEAMSWGVEAHKHLIGTWINGDGYLHAIHGHTGVTTTSYDLACQMHLLMARCGWFARMEAKVGARCVEVREILNGGFARCETTGKLPHFNLIIGKTQAVDMGAFTVKAPTEARYGSQGPRVRDDVVVFPITSIEESSYVGWVYNMQVDEDNSYVVEGVASHNCTVTGTICTKCGHWAADETESCTHIKYEKGNTFFDEQGRQHRVAELCGHSSIDPDGGVQFIEASWVGTPAFTGAVLRNIISVHQGDELGKAASAMLQTPPEEWTKGQRRKAAALAFGGEHFLAGWDDEGGDFGDEGGGEEAPKEPEKSKGPFEDLEDELTNHLKDRVRKRLKKDMDEKDLADALGPEDSSTSPNDNVVKQSRLMMDDLVSQDRKAVYGATMAFLCRTAAHDVDLIDKVALLNKEYGVAIPVPIYRAAVRLGSLSGYQSVDDYFRACQAALGRKPTTAEAKTLIRLGKLISRRGQARGGSRNPNLAVATGKE